MFSISFILSLLNCIVLRAQRVTFSLIALCAPILAVSENTSLFGIGLLCLFFGLALTLPDFVDEGLKKICRISETPMEEVHRDYMELLNDDFVQKDPQFESDEDRYQYSLGVLHSRYVARPPMKTFTIMPVGYTGTRIARSSGQPNCTISVLVKGERKIRRVVCRGELADQYLKINLFHSYTVRLGEFKSGVDLIADNRSKFESPVKVNKKPAEMMEKLNVKRISIADATKYPSAQRPGQKKGRTYVDQSDWRVVRGIVVRTYRGQRDDETVYGAYTIADHTVNGEPLVLDDGTIVRPGFTVWVHPSHMTYSDEDEIDAFGTVTINKDGDAQMNAFLILPVHIRGGR